MLSYIHCALSVNNQKYLCFPSLGIWFRAMVQSKTQKWPYPENLETSFNGPHSLGFDLLANEHCAEKIPYYITKFSILKITF